MDGHGLPPQTAEHTGEALITYWPSLLTQNSGVCSLWFSEMFRFQWEVLWLCLASSHSLLRWCLSCDKLQVSLQTIS